MSMNNRVLRNDISLVFGQLLPKPVREQGLVVLLPRQHVRVGVPKLSCSSVFRIDFLAELAFILIEIDSKDLGVSAIHGAVMSRSGKIVLILALH